MGKRLSPVAVAVENDDRFVGWKAAGSLFLRNPNHVATNVINLLGRSRPPSSSLAQIPFPNPSYEVDPNRGSLYLSHESLKDSLRIEEVAAFIFRYVEKIVRLEDGIEPPIDCVITIPPSFTQAQRQAVLDAAEIANLHVLALIGTSSAGPLWYGMERIRSLWANYSSTAKANASSSKTPPISPADVDAISPCVLFADVGAQHSVLSLVHYSPPAALLGKKPKKADPRKDEAGQMEVLEVITEEFLGGHQMDGAIVSLLMDQLYRRVASEEWQQNQGHCTPTTIAANHDHAPHCSKLLTSPRTLAKLWAEARKARETLTIAREAKGLIENAAEGIDDFPYVVTRAEFEERIEPLLARLRGLLERMRDSEKLRTCPYLYSFELLGGATRVPAVQALLTSVMERPLGRGLNQDEAAALGATMHAAALSPASVKVMALVPHTTRPVSLSILRGDEVLGPRGKATLLFPVGGAIPSRKAVTINKRSDFVANLFYDYDNPETSLPHGVGQQISRVQISGVEEQLRKYENVTKSAIKLTIDLAKDTQLLTFTHASMELQQELTEVLERNITNSTNSKPGEDVGTDAAPPTNAPDDAQESTEKAPEIGAASDSTAPSGTAVVKEAKLMKHTHHVPVKLTPVFLPNTPPVPQQHPSEGAPISQLSNEPASPLTAPLYISPLSASQVAASRQRLEHYEALDAHRATVAEARNALEERIYELGVELPEKEDIATLARPGEVETLVSACAEVREWLDDFDSDDSPAPYDERRAYLDQQASSLLVRLRELREYAPTLAAARSAARELTTQLQESNATAAVSLNASERALLNNTAVDFLAWLEPLAAQQAALGPSSDPALLSGTIAAHLRDFQAEITKILDAAAARVRLERIQKQVEEKARRKAEALAKAAAEAAKNSTASLNETRSSEPAEIKDEL